MSLALVAQVLAVPTFAATSEVGLIVNAVGTTNNNWTAYDENATVTATEDAVVMSETAGTTGYAKMIYSIPEDKQITFEDGKTVIIEMVVNPNITPVDAYGSYLAFRFNAPANAEEYAAYKAKDGTTSYNDGLYAQTLGGFCKGYYLGVQGDWSSAVSTVPYNGSKTYTMVSHLSENGSKASTYFYDENGVELWKQVNKAFSNANVDNSTVLKNFAVTELNPTKGTLNACTVTSLRIYNVPNADVNDYHKYDPSDLVVSDVKIGGADLEGATDVTEGDITFTATGKGDITVGLSYAKNDYLHDLVTVDVTPTKDGNNYTISGIDFEMDATYTLTIADTTGENSYTFTTEDGYTAKYGLVASTEGATTDGFTLYNTTRDTMSAEADGYVRVAQGEKAETAYGDPAAITYSLGANKVKFSDEDTIVIETRVRAGVAEYKNYGPYLHIGYNMPKNATEAASLKVLSTTGESAAYSKQGVSGTYPLVMGGLSHEYFYVANGSYVDAAGVTMEEVTSPWYKMVITMNATSMQLTIYDDAGDAQYTGAVTDIAHRSLGKYVENIGFTEVNPHDGKLTTDVDYIRVYNMPKGYEENYADFTTVVPKEDTMYKKTNGVLTIDAEEVVIKDADNEDVDFVATETEDGLVVRMLDFAAGNYTVNGVKYIVTAPYTATLADGKFVTDVPEAFEAEGAIFYKANYDATTGRLLAVDVVTDIVAETVSATVATDATTKVFLWDANMKPIKLR